MKLLISFVLVSFYLQADCKNVDADPRIRNGKPVSYEEYPYYVALIGKGGATLIRPTILLTAGHCLVNTTLSQIKPYWEGETQPIKKIIIHPEYSGADRYEHDIGLIVLTKPWNPAISVKLNTKHIADYTPAELIGRGKMENGEFPAGLMMVKTELFSFEHCNENIMYAPRTSMICESINSTDTGDSGGAALIRDDSGQIYLAGITSMARPDKRSNILRGIYTDVASHVPWIEEKLRELQDSQ